MTGIARPTTMKAIVRDAYGAPDVLGLQDVDMPDIADDGVLVRVRAVSVNQLDWYALTGTPYITRLEVVGELLDAGKVAPVIDRRYELSATADALLYMGEGHAQGKIVISL